MPNKILRFSVNQIVIDDKPSIDINDFDSIPTEEVDPQVIYKDKPEEETLSVKRVHKNITDNRFISVYILSGDKYPYSQKVVDHSLAERDNPRSPDEIELNKQLFVLIDTLTMRMYISDQRTRNSFCSWLTSKISSEVNVKAIFNEADFLSKIKSIDKLSFTITPNLFNSSSDSLTEHLVQDIHGYGAERARLELFYGNSRVTDPIMSKITTLMGRKYDFDDITVVGRSDGEMESVLNLNEITNTIIIDVPEDQESKLINYEEVFARLIGKVKNEQSN